MKKALVLTDGKAGHENQSRAFARALGCETVLVPVTFKSGFAKALSYLFDHLGVRTTGLFKPFDFPADADVVIGTGSGTFYAAKAVAKRLGIPCGVVLTPRGYDLASFTCILAPAFDEPPKRPNVVEIPANLVANDEAFYAAGKDAFLARHTPSGRDAVAVIVGGPNKCSTLTADWMKARLEEIFAANPGAEFWVTTSRRTPADVEAVVAAFPWNYALLYSKDHFNPIPAFVTLAKRLYVTAESTGMLSECCTFGSAEVIPLDNLLPGDHKFRRFARACAALGAEKTDPAPAFARARRLLEEAAARA